MKKRVELYKNEAPLGAWGIGYGYSLVVFEPIEDDRFYKDLVLADFANNYSNYRAVNIHATKYGREYVTRYGVRYYLDECMAIR